ncbi:hypothetical protein BH23GEM2_BH23GEM2_08330 [soil metagenome]
MTRFKDYSDGSYAPDADAHQEHAFAARLGQLLRQPEILEPGFDARVISQIRDVAAPGRTARNGTPGPQWGGVFRLDMTSGRVLALAASLAVAAFTGGVAFARGGLETARPHATVYADGTPAAATADTVYIVRFVLAHPGAARVSLVGSFNLWSEDANPLAFNANGGVWTASVRLPAGVHEYAYVVDGEHWTTDPLATSIADPLGIETSILRLHSNGHVGS